MCLRTLKASIGTISIFAKSSGSGSDRCKDSTAGHRVSGVLAERLQPGAVAHFRSHTALHLKSSLTSHLSVQKIKCTTLRTIKNSIGTVTTSQEVEAGARSVARTRQSVGPGELAERQHVAGVALRLNNRSGPESWQGDTTWLESLCQHSGHPLSGCRVRATDRPAAKTSEENGDGADGGSKL